MTGDVNPVVWGEKQPDPDHFRPRHDVPLKCGSPSAFPPR